MSVRTRPAGRADDRGGPTGRVAAPASLELEDGTGVLIRPITNDDRATLIHVFERLSARSRYLRFLGPKSRLTERELDYLTQVDHADHEALLAMDMADGQPLGVCRYVRVPPDGAAAEVAVAVVDAWQARGLGTALLRLLAERALAEGILRFTAVVLGENRRVIALFKRLGPVEVRYEHGLADVVVELTPESAR